ncbi:MAG: ribosome silencing factor [Spirochaetaceae bacterium]|jgi:ribosome-associated protein|nr:ribosome silencing factor [Spirochaetaceae bacterium]
MEKKRQTKAPAEKAAPQGAAEASAKGAIETSAKDAAPQLAVLINDGKGQDVVVIDVSDISSWTDFFVIATVTSGAHSAGLYRQVKDYAKENGLAIHVPYRKIPDGADWTLIDLGPIVVHLMSPEARAFYELEKLWVRGRVVR